MNICVFGDSIVWGAYDPENGGWATLLRNYFESADSPPYFREAGDVEVYNCGVSGDKTEDLLKRFEVEAQAREPNLIIFAIGINDSPILLSSNQRRISDENFKNNIFKLHTHTPLNLLNKSFSLVLLQLMMEKLLLGMTKRLIDKRGLVISIRLSKNIVTTTS